MQTNKEEFKAQKNFVNICSTLTNKESCSKTISRLSKENLSQQTCPVITSSQDTANELSEKREESSIPISTSTQLPKHQEKSKNDRWMYPSEKQFFNAMKNKGWHPEERDMKTIVSIHNTVNERAWREIMQWESTFHCECDKPKLKSFSGKSQEYSPKAKLLNFLGYKLPFDRHDWIIDRCGEEVRYVIDFYNAAPLPHMPIAMHLDVRPALDTFGAMWDRIKMQFNWIRSKRWLTE